MTDDDYLAVAYAVMSLLDLSQLDTVMRIDPALEKAYEGMDYYAPLRVAESGSKHRKGQTRRHD